MTNQQIITMLNAQLAKEIFSSYLYLAIANYYAEQNLDGFASWFEVQAKEELDHAMLFRRYLINRGTAVHLTEIAAPKVKYNKHDEGMSAALAHEQMITASIVSIYSAALDCKDYSTTQFLDWFIKEQSEEEKNANELCEKYKLFGNDAKGLYLLNAELKTRAYAPPTLVL